MHDASNESRRKDTAITRLLGNISPILLASLDPYRASLEIGIAWSDFATCQRQTRSTNVSPTSCAILSETIHAHTHTQREKEEGWEITHTTHVFLAGAIVSEIDAVESRGHGNKRKLLRIFDAAYHSKLRAMRFTNIAIISFVIIN